MQVKNEKIVNPLQSSSLNKKGLCDYVINIASGCLHGCTFCYVPSTPAIRTRQAHLRENGVQNPQMDWGQYLLIRDQIPEILEERLSRKRTWTDTKSGKGVIMLCSGTDPYQNQQTADITRQTIEILTKYNRRVRVLTRGLLWTKDLDILSHPNVTVGMSLPMLDDDLSRKIELHSPPPSKRYEALKQGYQAGCRLYIALAPTPPMTTRDDFRALLDKVLPLNPEVIFWEPINARGTNGIRMKVAGLDFVDSVMTKQAWADNFLRQWCDLEMAAQERGCKDKLHIWVDKELKGFTDPKQIEYWLYRPTVETWPKKQSILKAAIAYA